MTRNRTIGKAEEILVALRMHCRKARTDADVDNFLHAHGNLMKAETDFVALSRHVVEYINDKPRPRILSSLKAYLRQADNTYQATGMEIERLREARGI